MHPRNQLGSKQQCNDAEVPDGDLFPHGQASCSPLPSEAILQCGISREEQLTIALHHLYLLPVYMEAGFLFYFYF